MWAASEVGAKCNILSGDLLIPIYSCLILINMWNNPLHDKQRDHRFGIIRTVRANEDPWWGLGQ